MALPVRLLLCRHTGAGWTSQAQRNLQEGCMTRVCPRAHLTSSKCGHPSMTGLPWVSVDLQDARRARDDRPLSGPWCFCRHQQPAPAGLSGSASASQPRLRNGSNCIQSHRKRPIRSRSAAAVDARGGSLPDLASPAGWCVCGAVPFLHPMTCVQRNLKRLHQWKAPLCEATRMRSCCPDHIRCTADPYDTRQ